MNSQKDKQTRENQALEALVSAALHQDPEQVVGSEIIAKYMRGDFTLSETEEAALNELGENPLKNHKRDRVTKIEGDASLLSALHRQKPTEGFSKQTEEELAKRREELREKLRKQRDKGNE